MSSNTVSFYNEISDRYNEIMVQTTSNQEVREKVADYFKTNVTGETVLDFGGGTGLDLPWLHAHYSTVYFCEPSLGMREKASMLHLHPNDAHTLHILQGDQVDFRTWSKTLPFNEQVNGVLANFAVVNCIDDIYSLFDALALVVKPGGHVIALILDNSLKTLLKSYAKNLVKAILQRTPVITYARFQESQHTAYIYSTRALKKASGNQFNFHQQLFMGGYGFSLIHLIRK